MKKEFDVFAVRQMMEDVGVNHKQAEAIARSIELSRVDQENRIATKADINRLEQSTKTDINRLERSTKADIARLEQSTKADIKELKSDINRLEQSTKADLVELETRLEDKLNNKTELLRKEIENMGDKIVIRGCSIIIAAMFLFFKLSDVIQWFSK